MKRKLCLILAASLASASFLTACGGDKQVSSVKISGSDSYPLKAEEKLTYWMALNSSLTATVTNYGDTAFAKELAKRTGVEVKYIHPTLGQEGEAFNLMVASNDLPDMIEATWGAAMSGGPNAAIAGQVIRPLNDLMKEYSPALTKFLSENPDYDREIKLDDGRYYTYPSLRGDSILLTSSGPIVRADWLKELGLDTPKTIADWENMLTQFKEKKGASAPLSVLNSSRSAMFSLVGSGYDYYVDNGKVKFAPLEPEFKTAVETLHRWFEKGLLDQNYTLVDNTLLDSNILNGMTGATYGSGGGNLGKWLSSSTTEGFDLMGVTTPLDQKNEPNRFASIASYFDTYGTSITTACKNPELAAKYLDYAYTDEGEMFFNFGVEGETYELTDGNPIYKDVVLNNPDGLTVSQAMANYIHASQSGPYVQDKRYIMQYYSLDRQKEALNNWGESAEPALSGKLGNYTLNDSESSEYSNLYSEIKKYRDESVAAFINGTKPMDQYDEFIHNLEKMNADRTIEIIQAAYDRYLNRK